METSAPLLSRIKSWQLVGLGLSGWCALYSIALISWGSHSFTIGHAQGGFFAAAMALAGLEARRYRKPLPAPVDPLQWTAGISVAHVNLAIAQDVEKCEFRVEPCHPLETELGFGVRAVNAGRTMVYETAFWKEPVIDQAHVQMTEENRQRVSASLAVIVGVGDPDEAALTFAEERPVTFLCGAELKKMLTTPPAAANTPENPAARKTPFVRGLFGFIPPLIQRCRPSSRQKSRRRRL